MNMTAPPLGGAASSTTLCRYGKLQLTRERSSRAAGAAGWTTNGAAARQAHLGPEGPGQQGHSTAAPASSTAAPSSPRAAEGRRRWPRGGGGVAAVHPQAAASSSCGRAPRAAGSRRPLHRRRAGFSRRQPQGTARSDDGGGVGGGGWLGVPLPSPREEATRGGTGVLGVLQSPWIQLTSAAILRSLLVCGFRGLFLTMTFFRTSWSFISGAYFFLALERMSYF